MLKKMIVTLSGLSALLISAAYASGNYQFHIKISPNCLNFITAKKHGGSLTLKADAIGKYTKNITYNGFALVKGVDYPINAGDNVISYTTPKHKKTVHIGNIRLSFSTATRSDFHWVTLHSHPTWGGERGPGQFVKIVPRSSLAWQYDGIDFNIQVKPQKPDTLLDTICYRRNDHYVAENTVVVQCIREL